MSYYTKITKAGLAAITTAMNSNAKVPIAYMAFGDGNGVVPEPNENSNSLVNEVYRIGVNSVHEHEKNPNWLVCEAIIPSAVGGFNIREVALYDSTGGKMLAVASYPPTYKPSIEEGAAKIQTIRIILQVDNTGIFELIIDPDVVVATVDLVNKRTRIICESVEDLLTKEPYFNGQQAYLKAYYAGTSQGWGELTYDNQDNSTPDLVTTFPCVKGGLWKRQNLKTNHRFAADGGVINDPTFVNIQQNTEALQRVIDSCASGFTIELPVIKAKFNYVDLRQEVLCLLGKSKSQTRILTNDNKGFGLHEHLTIQNIALWGTGYASGGYILTDNKEHNRADVDLTLLNVDLFDSDFGAQVKGRGVVLDNVQGWNIRTAWIDVDFPEPFEPGPEVNMTLQEGHRGFIFKNIRHHYHHGFIFRNLGKNKENLQGVQFINVHIENQGKLFQGYAKNIDISGGMIYQRTSTDYPIQILGADTITINGFTMSNMLNPGTESPISSGLVEIKGDLRGINITGNTFRGVGYDLVRVTGTTLANLVKDIHIKNNVYIDCFNNPTLDQHIFCARTACTIKSLIVKERLVAPKANWYPVYANSSSTSVQSYEIDVIAEGSALTHPFNPFASLSNNRKFGVYKGTGNNEEKQILIGYKPRFLKVWSTSTSTGQVVYMGTYHMDYTIFATGLTVLDDKFKVTGSANNLDQHYFWEAE